MSDSLANLDGLITFYASHHAMRADKVLARAGLVTLLVPGPRDISPNCGVALQFEYRELAKAQELLAANKVHTEAFHQHKVELTDETLKRLGKNRL